VNRFIGLFVIERPRRLGEFLNFYRRNTARVDSFDYSDTTGGQRSDRQMSA